MKRERPKLKRISEQMRQWCALLESEVLSWPGAAPKPMFGMLAFYRKGRIFAAVPRTRGLGSDRTVIFKLDAAPQKLREQALADPRVTTTQMGKAGWIAFELDSLDDVREALRWFAQAYELVGGKKQPVPRR